MHENDVLLARYICLNSNLYSVLSYLKRYVHFGKRDFVCLFCFIDFWGCRLA